MSRFAAWLGFGSKPPEHLDLGRRGEDLAARFLRRRGMRILARNYAAGKYEMDIVAGDGDTVVFVEVKTRRSLSHGPPEAAVSARKRRHLPAVAARFLKESGRQASRAPCRFDVVAIDWSDSEQSPTVRHITDAFSWSERGKEPGG